MVFQYGQKKKKQSLAVTIFTIYIHNNQTSSYFLFLVMNKSVWPSVTVTVRNTASGVLQTLKWSDQIREPEITILCVYVYAISHE